MVGGRLVMVLGGQKSGKSTLATEMAAAKDGDVLVVAPALAGDAEMAERIAIHQSDRPSHWATVERFDVAEVIRTAPPEATIIVDAIDTWLTQAMTDAGLWTESAVAPWGLEGRTAADAIVSDATGIAAAARSRVGDTIVIAGQPGLGAHAMGAAQRRYVDLHGRALQALTAQADRTMLVVAGRPLELPVAPPNLRSELVTHQSLRLHGDTQVPAGSIDLAVNVEAGPPDWLARQLADAVADLADYPGPAAAEAAQAARHGVDANRVLACNGAADAFWLLAQGLRPRHAVCVHPSFTEPEAALRAASTAITRVQRRREDDWALDATMIPSDADLVVVGRPSNPTGAMDPAEVLSQIARPGRTLVVDEAFADHLPDAAGLLGEAPDMPGLVVVRSLTKLWGLAGLRVGYLIGPAELVQRLRDHRQPWSVSTPALVALAALATREPERQSRVADVAARRDDLAARLADCPVRSWISPANFALLHSAKAGLRDRLLAAGLAARQGNTFPGLDDHYVRVAVRDQAIHQRLAAALSRE